MDIEKIVKDLREQRSLLEEAILVMEKLARTQSPRRGRPPKWLNGVANSNGTARQRVRGERAVGKGLGRR